MACIVSQFLRTLAPPTHRSAGHAQSCWSQFIHFVKARNETLVDIPLTAGQRTGLGRLADDSRRRANSIARHTVTRCLPFQSGHASRTTYAQAVAKRGATPPTPRASIPTQPLRQCRRTAQCQPPGDRPGRDCGRLRAQCRGPLRCLQDARTAKGVRTTCAPDTAGQRRRWRLDQGIFLRSPRQLICDNGTGRTN